MNDVEHLVMCLLAICMEMAKHLFGEMFVQVFFPLFDWVVCFSAVELYELRVYFEN